MFNVVQNKIIHVPCTIVDDLSVIEQVTIISLLTLHYLRFSKSRKQLYVGRSIALRRILVRLLIRISRIYMYEQAFHLIREATRVYLTNFTR